MQPMRDFSNLHGVRRTLKKLVWNPTSQSACVTCNCQWLDHRQEPTDTACRRCTCETFVVDTSGPPDEAVTIVEWHHPETDALISDPYEVAELDRRVALVGGANGRT
jgi:hypothetical protein